MGKRHPRYLQMDVSWHVFHPPRGIEMYDGIWLVGKGFLEEVIFQARPKPGPKAARVVGKTLYSVGGAVFPGGAGPLSPKTTSPPMVP